ncbi:MAG: response regulator [Deltaproteobacteria bacterium]|nr:response regulator [Deltaproteobacteria bacterium]
MTNVSCSDSIQGNILVVDDVPANLTLLTGILKEEGHLVRPVPSGKLALKAVEIEPPDIILLDIMMPVMDGYETCRHLKDNPKTRDIPIVFLTAKTEVEDETKGFELGAVDYITKPISPPVVLARVQTHLRLKRMQDSLKDQNQFLDAAVQKHTKDLVAAQDKLGYLIQTGLELGLEHDRIALLRKILFGAKTLLNCDAGTLYMVTEHNTLRFAQRTKSDDLSSFEIPLYDEAGAPVERFMATWCALHNEPIIVDDVYSETRFDVSGAKKMDAESGYRTVSMLTVPLSPREGEVIGVMQFINALDPETGKVIPFPPELLRFVGAMAAQSAVALDNFQLLAESERRLKITKAYTRDSLVRIIQDGGDPTSYQPKEINIAVFFNDIRDFTSFSEKMPPIDVVKFLNTYFDMINEIIIRNRGEIDKLIGDCVMAAFGDPLDAVRAAIEANRALNEYNRKRVEQNLRIVKTGIGITYGSVIIGNIGSASKLDYTLIGDTVNTASRLESLTKHYGVSTILSDDLVKCLHGISDVRFLDIALVKGKKEPIKIYELYEQKTDQIKDIYKRIQPELDRAFHLYYVGEIDEAYELYCKIAKRIGSFESCANEIIDPALIFYKERCERILREARSGLINMKLWNGVYEFKDK